MTERKVNLFFSVAYWGMWLGFLALLISSKVVRSDHKPPQHPPIVRCEERSMTLRQFNSLASVRELNEHDDRRNTPVYPFRVLHLRFNDSRTCRLSEVLSAHDHRAYNCVCVSDVRMLR